MIFSKDKQIGNNSYVFTHQKTGISNAFHSNNLLELKKAVVEMIKRLTYGTTSLFAST
jgi:hypothetical protein